MEKNFFSLCNVLSVVGLHWGVGGGEGAIIISKVSGNNSSFYSNAGIHKLYPAGQIQPATLPVS